MSITIKEALDLASKELSKSVINSKKEARILLSCFLDKDDIYLISQNNKAFENEEGFFDMVKRRANHEPLEYITKKVSFYSRDFMIDKGVLIPRPETEILVDKSVELIEQLGAKEIAEIGTGSGVISIMLAHLCKDIKITATDISPGAIELARQNAIKHGVEHRINFVLTNYIDGISLPQILISNPPYIAKSVELERHVLNEPHTALFGGDEGDEMLKDIVKIYTENSKIIALACEMGYDQKSSLQRYFEKEEVRHFSFYKDLSGLYRGFTIKKEIK